MTLWAIIPVKPLRRGKSRLAGVLSEDERTLLNYSMLGNTLKAVREVKEINEVLIISKDPSALALGREYGARTVQEDGNPGLNTALQRATIIARAYAVQDILILPADLPLIKAENIREFISCAGNPPEMIIAPDRRMDGTNALYLGPAGLINYSFGPGSFNKHIAQANKNNIHVTICEISSLSLDLDLPEDLAFFRKSEYAGVNL